MKDVTDRCWPRDFGFSKKLFFDKYLYFRPREDMGCRNPANRFFNQLNQIPVFCNARKVGLRIVKRVHLCWNEPSEIQLLAKLLIPPDLLFP